MENTTQQKVNFEKFSHESNRFINKLSEELGHPEEQNRSFILLRSVMHVIRDRIAIPESFDLMSQLPLILRGIYTEQWKFHDKPPLEYDTIEEMKEEVKNLQSRFGEVEFNWEKSTEELISIVINCLKEYLSEGQIDHIRSQMPKEVKGLI
ncbi:DUF2267 domain-containing protein [Marivirga sp. S37H4]|uniref:DUF2267 domain-containing protein n=1 Tax=Marivirga aurantiaca TaxID=2802615 RepID=A0A935C9A3_9BACT|nr:DUF2267 domain-containing protein [Marivirga aurantiaca]MBK6265884.1 DUF2267 domain-containing protein [Marivirga aurantiaca]